MSKANSQRPASAPQQRSRTLRNSHSSLGFTVQSGPEHSIPYTPNASQRTRKLQRNASQPVVNPVGATSRLNSSSSNVIDGIKAPTKNAKRLQHDLLAVTQSLLGKIH